MQDRSIKKPRTMLVHKVQRCNDANNDADAEEDDEHPN